MSRGRHQNKQIKIGNPYFNRSTGRWYVYTRQERAYEFSRIVKEAELGRELESHEIVHHINHDSSDDRPENLLVVQSQQEHAQFHPKWGGIVGDVELLEHLMALHMQGFVPTAKDLNREPGYTHVPYYRAFGSLSRARVEAGIGTPEDLRKAVA